MLRTGLQMSLLVLVVGLLLWRESRLQPAARVEAAFAEALAHAGSGVRGQLVKLGWAQAPSTAPVTLVAITDASLQKHAWPWSPLDYSLFLRAALPLQPAVLAFGPVLNWDRSAFPMAEQQKLSQYERTLQDYLRRTPKLLMGEQLGWPEDPDAPAPVISTPLVRHVTGPLQAVPEWTAVEEPASADFRIIGQVGFTNLQEDPAGVSAVPLLLRYRGQVVPSLVLQSIILWQAANLDDVRVVLGSHLQIGNGPRIPIDAAGRVRVNWQAPHTVISFDDLMLATEQAEAKQKPVVSLEPLRNSVTMLARTDKEARTVPLPSGARRSPGELFTAAIATIQSGAYVERVPTWFDLAILATAMLASVWLPRVRRRVVAWGALVLLLSYLVAAAVIYSSSRVWLPIVLPAGLLIFVVIYRAVLPKPLPRPSKPVIL